MRFSSAYQQHPQSGEEGASDQGGHPRLRRAGGEAIGTASGDVIGIHRHGAVSGQHTAAGVAGPGVQRDAGICENVS